MSAMLGFIEKYQQRQNKKFEKKVADSVIVKTKTVSAKKLKIFNDQKRLKSLIFLLLTFLYTIVTKIILGKFSFDFLIALNIVLFLTDLYLRLNGNSVWALNHYQKVSIVTFLNKLLTTLIFFWATFLHIEELFDYLHEYEEPLREVAAACATPAEELWMKALFLLKEKTVFMVSFLYSLVMFIPTLLYFIKRQIYYYSHNLWILIALAIPILNIVAIIKWIMNFRNFKEYVMIDDETCQVNYRKMNNGWQFFYKAVLKIAFFAVIIYLIVKYL